MTSWKDRKLPAAALRGIYTAPTAEAASAAFDAFAAGPWGLSVPRIVKAWRPAWTHVIPFFAFPPAVRRVIDTTNALDGGRSGKDQNRFTHRISDRSVPSACSAISA